MTDSSASFLETLQAMSAGQWLDALFVVVALWCAIGGLRHGLVREVFGLVGLIAAFAVASGLHRAVHAGTGIDFGLPVAAAAAAAWYAILWTGTWLVFKIASWAANRTVATEDGKLTVKNRASGALFGTLKGGFLVGLAAFVAAAVDPARIPFVGSQAASVLDGSRAVRFARENPQAVGWLAESQVVSWASGRMLDAAADQILARDLGIEDPALRANGSALMRPLLEHPERARLLGRSPTGAQAMAALEAVPAFRAFAASSPELAKLRAGEDVDPARLREAMKTEGFRAMLRDPAVLAALRSVDYARIAGELEGLESGR